MAIRQRVRFDAGRRITESYLTEPDEVLDGRRIHRVDDHAMSYTPNLTGPTGALAQLGLEFVGRDPFGHFSRFAEKPTA